MIIGTAGHIDHGKSALVTALTGRAVDRLEEERRRGITIDLNFAPLEFPGLDPVGIIDVPGHEDLVRTMVAGASGIDLVLLVIDLTEGPRPQTEEHLAILEQLRIPAGIPVFTKADLVESDWADLVVADATARLARSSIRFEPPAIVAAPTGRGIDALRTRLEAWARTQAARPAVGPFRMPVDRVFSRAGVGTVVTGTTWSGSVSVGDQVTILPGGARARIRSVEAYGRSVGSARPAVRTALGMTGVERAGLGRGHVVVTGDWTASAALDAELELLPDAAPLRRNARVRVHLGTAEVLARVSVSDGVAIGPGQRRVVRLVLETPLVARGGDRLVIRNFSPVTTIGGGWVVDPLPPPRSRPTPDLAATDAAARIVALAARRRFGIALAELPQVLGDPEPEKLLTRAGPTLVRVSEHLVPAALLSALADRAVAFVTAHHQAEPGTPGLSAETLRSRLGAPEALANRVLADLQRTGALRVAGGFVARAGFVPALAGGEQAVEDVVRFVAAAGLAAPTLDEIGAGVGIDPIVPAVRRAVESGAIQAVDRDRFASREALDRFRATLAEIGQAGEITPAAVRDRLALTRKHLIPLLEWADRQGVTRRVGEARMLVQNGR
ncbi:MAG: selenocysteine-specific translation elongation factor [Gemmatimonadales bacterium]|nr:selenocysteine-specific translation elongation factor [Gemmatimonadales bacterium]